MEWPMLHYEQVFSNFSERRGSKCCAVLTKHLCKVKRWTSDDSPNGSGTKNQKY